MIFLDSNVPMYLVGASHPHKDEAGRLLARSVVEGKTLVTDAEVLQEILHRYVAINRRDAIGPAFDALLGLVDEVFPIERSDALRAHEVLTEMARLSARDAIHLAVMEHRGVREILTFDQAFDRAPAGIRRVR